MLKTIATSMNGQARIVLAVHGRQPISNRVAVMAPRALGAGVRRFEIWDKMATAPAPG
jgi:hypothetical protein